MLNGVPPKNLTGAPLGDDWCEYGDTGVWGYPIVDGEIECCDTGVSGSGVSASDVGGTCDGDVGYALVRDEITVGIDCCCCCCGCCFEDRSEEDNKN